MRREGRAHIFPLKTSAGEGRRRSKHFCFGVKTGSENWEKLIWAEYSSGPSVSSALQP